MAKGTIKRIFEDRGYGFIQPDGRDDDVWFHASKVKGEISFVQLNTGLEVEYETEPGRRGGLQAKFVRPVATSSVAQSLTQSAAKYRFLNPYNFVRFLIPINKKKTGKPQTALGAAFAAVGRMQELSVMPEDQLLGRFAPPPHDRYVGLTGKISCTLETVTPLFISDPDFKSRGEHKSYEFFKLEGKHALPAASLRGIVRSVFEAATNSCMIHFTGQRLSKHLEATEARKLWPARVTKENGKWFLHIMVGTTPFSINGPAQGQRLPAAWIMQYDYGKMQSSPTCNFKPNKSNPYCQRNPVPLPRSLKHGEECWALLEPMSRPSRLNRQGKTIAGFEFWNVKQIATSQSDLPSPAPGERVERGWLCLTNHNIENKHDERFFFASTVVSPIQIPEEVRKDYKDLIEDYQNRHRDRVQRRRAAGFEPEQPLITKDKKEAAFSRFILEGHAELRDGDLVYALLREGPDQNPTVWFIVPVSVPRVSYDKSLTSVLFENHPQLKPCQPEENNRLLLCPACRVFGWVHTSPSKETERVAYTGRVQFTHGRLIHSAGTLPQTPLAILSSPKPTTTRFYLKPKSESISETWSGESAEQGYDGDNVLRGRKFYRHHGIAREEEFRRAGDVCDDQNRTVCDALLPGARFEFTVSFENLAPIELGALLWSLEMDEKGHHRLGFAKPLGFGSAKIKIDEVQVQDFDKRYSSLGESGWRPVANWNKCISIFKVALVNRYGTGDFEELDNVKDLRALLNDPPNHLPVHYPRTARQPDPSGRNFEWFIGNKRPNLRYTLPIATEDAGLPLITRDGIEVK